MIKKPRKLIYDIETCPLWFRSFSTGKQVLRHGALVPIGQEYSIICLAYAIDDGPVKVLEWDMNTGNCEKLIQEFDEIVKSCDIVIGKNSDRFDNKHVNTQRWRNGLPAMPDWLAKSDDLEKQIRKYFYLPSYSLDHISHILGLGGKNKMSWEDWEDIDNFRVFNLIKSKDSTHNNKICNLMFGKSAKEVKQLGKIAFEKMKTYNIKDVEDTRDVLNSVIAHIEPKFNMNTYAKDQGLDYIVCKSCGSNNIHKNGKRYAGQTVYQSFYCNNHGGYAGKASIKTNKNGSISYGNIQ